MELLLQLLLYPLMVVKPTYAGENLVAEAKPLFTTGFACRQG